MEMSNMSLANLKEIKSQKTTSDRTRTAIQISRDKPDDRIDLGMIPSRKVRHLNVDEILDRSLPTVKNK